MEIKKLKSNVLWLSSSRFVYAIMQWLTVISIARLGNAEMLGLYTYSVALISPIIILSQLNMRSFVVTDAISKYEYSEYYTTRMIMTVVVFACSIIYIVFFNKDLMLLWVLLLVLVFKCIESMSDILNAFQQKSEKMSIVATSNILRGCLLFASVGFSLYVLDSLATGLILVSIIWLSIFIFFDMFNLKQLNIKLTLEKEKSYAIIRECFPLGVIGALVSVSLYVPSYVIESNYGYKEVGVFASLMYFLLIGRLFIGSIVQAIAPKVSRICVGNTKTSIIKLALMLISSGVLFAMLFIVFMSYLGESLLLLIYGEEFVQYINVLLLIIYASSVGFINQFMGILLTSMRSFKKMLLVQFIQVFTVVYLCVIYVPTYGLIAAAYSVIAGSSILFVFNLFIFYLSIKQVNNNRIRLA